MEARNSGDWQALCWDQVPDWVAAVQALGDQAELPFIAAQADLGDPTPMSDEQGIPYAVSTFRWIDPAHEYWLDRKLALQVPFLTAVRLTAEPFWYSNGTLGTWRDSGLLSGVDCSSALDNPHLGEAIIAPVHQPRGVVGAIVWCSREPVGVKSIFDKQAALFQTAAIRLIAAHNEARGRPRNATVPKTLTRREVQCLRWAAAGKTDGEIGIILDLSVSTVRFHLRNAAAKLGATGRAQSIQLAAGLGYVGAAA